jgi:FOG: HEAT repeat
MDTKQIKENLKSGDISKIKDALYYLFDNKTYDDEIVALVVSLVTSDDKGVQSLAIDCLANLPEEFRGEASKHLVPLIGSHNIEYRNIVSDILTKYDDVCYEHLKKFLLDPDADFRQFALDIWGAIGSKKDWGTVRYLLNDNNRNVVVSAIMALGNIKVPDVVDDLIKKYEEDDEYKPFVLNAVAKIGGEKAKKLISEALSNETDQLLQLAAIDSLAYIDGDEEFFDYLMSKLPTVPKQIQPYFLKGLCHLGKKYCDRKVIPDDLRYVARESLKESDPEVRKSALFALGGIYQSLDLDYLIIELFRFDPENVDLIFTNVLHNSPPEVLGDFLEKITFQKDNGELFSVLLEFVFREWNALKEPVKLVLMESILGLSDELPESVQNDFYDFFVYRDAELFKNVFENLLKSSKFVNREKLEEIGLRYELL